jgi:biopolymer transport protein ExbD
MAEITQSGSSHGHGKIRTKKRSTKIDMTPMVDLAFLLLTFFILTTTFKDKMIMRVDMPSNEGGPGPKISHEKVLNLVLAENNKVYWWIGFDSQPQLTNYSKDGIRKLLLEKSQAIPELMVLIKPKDNSKYENMVDVLDEISITKTQRYAIVDFSAEDKTKIAGH